MLFVVVFVQFLSWAQLFATQRTTARQASLSFSISLSLLKPVSIELVILSNYLIPCHLLLLPSGFSSIRVFSNELALHIRWPKHWSFSTSSSNEYSGLTSFRLDWFDFLAVKGLSRLLSITTGWRHQFCGTRPSLRSNPHIHMWLLEKPLCNHCQKLWPHLLPSSPADCLTPN